MALKTKKTLTGKPEDINACLIAGTGLIVITLLGLCINYCWPKTQGPDYGDCYQHRVFSETVAKVTNLTTEFAEDGDKLPFVAYDYTDFDEARPFSLVKRQTKRSVRGFSGMYTKLDNCQKFDHLLLEIRVQKLEDKMWDLEKVKNE